jgi:uncharacterized protein (TIGR02284 family)
MAHELAKLKEAEDSLQSVVNSLIDSQVTFRKLGEEMNDPLLKEIFLAESMQRARFRGDIESVLHEEGVHDITETGTVAGTLRRAWGEVKSHIARSDVTLVERAESSEDAIIKVYAEALETASPFPVRQMIVSQYASINSTHDFVKSVRDLARKAA